MISHQSVLLEIERQVSAAKRVQSEAEIKASLTAIQALCNVALNNHIEQPQRLSQAQVVTPQTIAQSKLEEEDANGDSLFDF